ncbi:5-formyltetrahydrofolate cyclo-ligase [Brevibacillus daliensis]|uniref:5-formyltetrahydrofolate cyclo-ligase n=1 Tax=Brevibacillus daliensis TaxID=2892995 RepID=UPI001E3BE380|nr:5-formyltetrahydrofolate cyclo-ligase [Brevibacillus daliensis]
MNREEKGHIRKQVLAMRDTIPANIRQEKSLRIAHHLLADSEIIQRTTIMCFSSFGSEINTLPFIEKASTLDKKLCLPLTFRSTKELIPYYYQGREQLKSGVYGIMEPDPTISQKVALTDIEIILVPGIAFDRAMGRLGYGAGYYDRFIEKVPHALRIGVCFSEQILDKIPMESHDKHLHAIVTEDGIVRI